MRINVASKNPIKVEAVKEIVKEYDFLKDAEIVSLEASSNVSTHPLNIGDTVEGAINRAKNCFKDCNYSFGIESGLMNVPHTKVGSMDTTACAIYDGKKLYLGLSSGFEYPPIVTKMIREGVEASEAFRRLKLTDHVKIGATEGGIIGLLTKGRVKRKDYTKQAIYNALIHLENQELYNL